MREKLDAIEKDRNLWIYREDQLTSELKQTEQCLEKLENKERIKRTKYDSLHERESNITPKHSQKILLHKLALYLRFSTAVKESRLLFPEGVRASIEKLTHSALSKKSALSVRKQHGSRRPL